MTALVQSSILLNRIHHPVTVLGHGTRAGVWFQGCTIRCPGCMAIDTWRPDAATAVPVTDVLGWLAILQPAELDGITISGGEPTEQPEALASLLSGICSLRQDRPPGVPPLDVLVYTGRPVAWAKREGRAILAGADAVVAGPFVAEQAGTSPLRGSENQRLILLTRLGADRYAADRLPARDTLQVEVADGEVRLTGIPLPGVLDSIENGLRQCGFHVRGRTWQ